MAAGSKRPTRLKGVAVALAGVLMLVAAAVMAFQSLRVLRFHSIEGTVVSKRLDSVVAGRVNLHKPVIEYSYLVNGIPYQNNVFNLAGDDGEEEWARAILRSYRVGAACTVYYDPSNPQTSALSTSPTTRATVLMIGSAFLGLVHLIGGILVARDAPLPNEARVGRKPRRGVPPNE